GRGGGSKEGGLFTLDEEVTLQDNCVVSDARQRIIEAEAKVLEIKSHSDFKLKSLHLLKDKAVLDAKAAEQAVVVVLREEVEGLEREVEKLKGENAVEVRDLIDEREEAVMRCEVKYEKRLGKDMESYMNLRNAYDDLQVAATDNTHQLEDIKEKKKSQMMVEFEGEKKRLEEEQQLLLEYNEYCKNRYDEVLSNTDVLHDVEVIGLKKSEQEKEAELHKQLKMSQGETGMMQRQNKVLREALEMRDLKNYELKDTIEKEKQRCKYFQEEEKKKNGELVTQINRANKWEKSSGGQKRQIIELEKARKVIIAQLHEVRSMLEPKDHEIRDLRTKLQELEGGLQSAITNTTEVEKVISTKSKRIGNLSDTVRNQRRQLGDKGVMLQNLVTQINIVLSKSNETGDLKGGQTELLELIVPFLGDEKNGGKVDVNEFLANQKEQREREMNVRRTLEGKVAKLERAIAEERKKEGGGDELNVDRNMYLI
ncbi:hypothetical protein ScalyP_jg118, partial [Parmales sp. scaly parma]